MRLFVRSSNPVFRKLRYRAAGVAALISSLSAVPALAIPRHYPVLGLAALGVQLVLLLFLMRLLFQALRLARGLEM